MLVLYIFRGYTGINAKDSDDGREALLWSWRSIKVLSCICVSVHGAWVFAYRKLVFVPESYVILRLQPRFQNGEWVRWNQELPLDAPTSLQEEAKRFSSLKVGFRGDLKFQEHPDIIELAPLLERQQRMGLKLTQS